MGVLALAVMTKSKIANQNLIVIEDTSLEDSRHLSKLDRIIKTIMIDTKEVKVLPQKLEHETEELLFQTKDGVELYKKSIKRNRKELELLDVVGNPLHRKIRKVVDKSYKL